MADFNEWYRNVPFFTKWWLTLTVGFTLLGRFGFFSPVSLILAYEPIFYRFQIWRLLTCVFYYPLSPGTGFHFLFNLYFLYNYSLRLETGIFDGKPADYCFMLLFNWIVSISLALFMGMPLLMDVMVLSVLYVYCSLHKDDIVNFWFGTRFKAMYLPWVLLVFNVVVSGGGLTEAFGIIVGHIYFFLAFKYPLEFNGASFLTTPAFLYDIFPNQRGGIRGFAPTPRPNPGGGAGGRPAGRGGHDWGRGNVLGGN